MTNWPFSNWNSIAAPSTVTLVFRRRPITNYCELNPRADTSIPTFGITSTSPSSTLRQTPARITDPPFHDNHPRTGVRPISLPEKPCGIRLKPATTYLDGTAFSVLLGQVCCCPNLIERSLSRHFGG